MKRSARLIHAHLKERCEKLALNIVKKKMSKASKKGRKIKETRKKKKKEKNEMKEKKRQTECTYKDNKMRAEL